MKRIFYFILVCLSIISCTQTNNVRTVKPVQVPTKYKALALVDTVFSMYPNAYVNDVQKERFRNHLYMELDKKLTEDNAFLSEIPMKFAQMMKKQNNKYIVKFECGEYSTKDDKLKSLTCMTEIDFAIFAEVDEDCAANLIDNAQYYLTGIYKGYVDNKLKLPSGKVFTYPNSCFKSSLDSYGSVCLGGFLFDELKVTPKM